MASRSSSAKTRSGPLPKWLLGMILVVVAVILGVVLTVSISRGIRANNDRDVFKSVKVTLSEEATRLSDKLTPKVHWVDISTCDFSGSESNVHNLWTCTADYSSSVVLPEGSDVSFTQKLVESFREATDLFTFPDASLPTILSDQASPTYVVNATDIKTHLACSLAIANSIQPGTDSLSVDLKCSGVALQSWYRNNGLSNQTSPGSNAWKY